MTAHMDVQANLSLTEAIFSTLLSLASGPRYGYAIIKDVRTVSNARVLLSSSTLYGALKRLLEQQWIVRVDELDSNGTGHPRKSYTLTELGRRVLDAETERLGTLVAVTRLRLVGELACARRLDAQPSCMRCWCDCSRVVSTPGLSVR